MLTLLQRAFLYLSLVIGASGYAVELDSLLARSPFIRDGYNPAGQGNAPKPSRPRKPIGEQYEIRGVFTQQGKQMVSVWLKQEKRAMWVTVGEETYPGFPVFSEYDPVERAFWVETDGRREQLALAESDFSKNGTVAQAAPSFVSKPASLKPATQAQPNQTVSTATTNRRTVVASTPRRPTNNQRSTTANNRPSTRRIASTSGPAQAPPPPPSFNTGRAFTRSPQASTTPGLQINTPTTTGGNNTSTSDNTSTTTPSTTDTSTQTPEVQRPVGAPPQNPTSQPPQNVPQLPPGFDLEQYLQDRANGG